MGVAAYTCAAQTVGQVTTVAGTGGPWKSLLDITPSLSTDSLVLRGELKGHTNWVTSIATTDVDANLIVTGSRDKSLVSWKLGSDGESLGRPHRRLQGHSHFVSDVTLSSDGQYALSGSWDGTLRLWDLETGVTKKQFQSHKKDVLSVAFSADNRQIVSGSRDKTVKLWNTIG